MLKVCTRNVKETSRTILLKITNKDNKGPRKQPFRAYQAEEISHGIHLQYIFMFFARTVDCPAAEPFPRFALNERQQAAWLAITDYLANEDLEAVRVAVDWEDERKMLLPVKMLCLTFFLSLVEQQSRRKETNLAFYIAVCAICVNGEGF
jgi:hypothetical protein